MLSARHGARRVPEKALHLLELFGGWPGALVAQPWFRHKTGKFPFRLVVWAIAAAHLGAWIHFGTTEIEDFFQFENAGIDDARRRVILTAKLFQPRIPDE